MLSAYDKHEQFDNITSIINSLRNEESKGINVKILFGEIPKHHLGMIGSIILMGAMLYFWAHLKTNVTFGNFQYPWIFIYKNSLAKFLTIISLLILPVLASGIFITETQYDYLSRWIIGGITLFNLAVALRILKIQRNSLKARSEMISDKRDPQQPDKSKSKSQQNNTN